MAEEIENIEGVVDSFLYIFGNRWNLLILHSLFEGQKGFNELKRSLEPVSQSVLTAHLKQLVDCRVITRQPAKDRSTVQYSMSESGLRMVPWMTLMYDWMLEDLRTKV